MMFSRFRILYSTYSEKLFGAWNDEKLNRFSALSYFFAQFLIFYSACLNFLDGGVELNLERLDGRFKLFFLSDNADCDGERVMIFCSREK